MGVQIGDQSQGLPSGFWGTVTKSYVGVWATERGAVLAFHVHITPDEDSDVDEGAVKFLNPCYYSLGTKAMEYFRPSIDDKTPLFGWTDADGTEHHGGAGNPEVEATYGRYLMETTAGKGRKISGGSKFGDFYNHLIKGAGFDPMLVTDDWNYLTGTYGFWERVPEMDRKGIPDYEPGEILVLTEIKRLPPKGGVEPSDAPAPAPAAAASGKAKTTRKKRRRKKSGKTQEEPLEVRVEAAVTEIVKVNDNERDFATIIQMIGKRFDGPEAAAALQLVMDKAWLGSRESFDYDTDDDVAFIEDDE